MKNTKKNSSTNVERHIIQRKKSWKNQPFTTTEPSETIKDESFTIRELLEKHTQGLFPDDLQREALYEEEPDLENPPLNKQPDFDKLEDQKQLLNKAKSTILQASEEAEEIKKGKAKSKGTTLGSGADDIVPKDEATTLKGDEVPHLTKSANVDNADKQKS